MPPTVVCASTLRRAACACRALALAALVFVAPPARTLHAQPPRGARHVVSVQPLHAAFGTWAGEYERALDAPGTSVGIAGALSRWDHTDEWGGVVCFDACWDRDAYPGFATADVRLRWYGGERALTGHAWGLSAGAVTWRERREGAGPASADRIRWSGRYRPTVGLTYERSALGDGVPAQLAMGVGAKYVIEGGAAGVVPFYLTLRMSIGYVF